MNIRTDRLPDATTGGPKKIFAVLSRSVTVRGKTIRHVLIFDNHPASVRLLLRTHLINREPVRCQRFVAAARREEGEYPRWIFERRATPPQRQRSATLRAKHRFPIYEMGSSSDPAPRRRNEFLYLVLAIVLVLATGLGMFWPLL